MFCLGLHAFSGHKQPAAGLGDHTRLECQLERLESRSICYAADRQHGEHDAGYVQKTPETPERTKGSLWNCCRILALQARTGSHNVLTMSGFHSCK